MVLCSTAPLKCVDERNLLAKRDTELCANTRV